MVCIGKKRKQRAEDVYYRSCTSFCPLWRCLYLKISTVWHSRFLPFLLRLTAAWNAFVHQSLSIQTHHLHLAMSCMANSIKSTLRDWCLHWSKISLTVPQRPSVDWCWQKENRVNLCMENTCFLHRILIQRIPSKSHWHLYWSLVSVEHVRCQKPLQRLSRSNKIPLSIYSQRQMRRIDHCHNTLHIVVLCLRTFRTGQCDSTAWSCQRWRNIIAEGFRTN